MLHFAISLEGLFVHYKVIIQVIDDNACIILPCIACHAILGNTCRQYNIIWYITMATTFCTQFFRVQKMVAMAMYYITVKAPLTLPLYLYFASASPRQNIIIHMYITLMESSSASHAMHCHIFNMAMHGLPAYADDSIYCTCLHTVCVYSLHKNSMESLNLIINVVTTLLNFTTPGIWSTQFMISYLNLCNSLLPIFSLHCDITLYQFLDIFFCHI